MDSERRLRLGLQCRLQLKQSQKGVQESVDGKAARKSTAGKDKARFVDFYQCLVHGKSLCGVESFSLVQRRTPTNGISFIYVNFPCKRQVSTLFPELLLFLKIISSE